MRWKEDIKKATGQAVEYPMIGDSDLKVAKLYGMLPADAGDSSDGRTAADKPDRALGLRCGTRQEGQACAHISHDHGPQFCRNPARDRFHPVDRQASGGDARQLAAGRGCDHHTRRFQRGRRKALRFVRDDPCPICGRPSNRRAVPFAGQVSGISAPEARCFRGSSYARQARPCLQIDTLSRSHDSV